MRWTKLKPRWTDVALLALAGTVVLVTMELRSARSNVATLLEHAGALQVGFHAPVAKVADIEGHEVTLGETDGRALVYLVFNIRCPYCKATAPFWRELHARYEGSADVRVLGVSLDSTEVTRRYLAENGLRMRTVVVVEDRVRDIHKFHAVPLILVVDPGGRVVFSRLGVVDSPAVVDSVYGAIDELATAPRHVSERRSP